MRSHAAQRNAAEDWRYQRSGSSDDPPLAEVASQPLAAAPASGSLTQMDYHEYSAIVKQALRNFCRSDLLARSVLMHSRLLASGATASDLQGLLRRTADELFRGPRDEKLRRVLELAYFRPAPKQEVAAERLGLAFSTYRRHLAAALDRLGRWLWKLERAAPAHAPSLSIVVLPFANLSSEDGLGYVVDGITENLTTDLSRVPDMLVIDRNTAFTYQGKALDPREIGRELRVHYVMEGSVQAEGNRLRINAKLIDAETGAQLWADRFDKPRDNPFDVQDEITARLARSVDIQLVDAASRRALAERPNELSSADMTLRARAVWNRPFSLETVREARRHYETALRLDECNLAALVGLADSQVREVAFYGCGDRREHIRLAEDLVARALTLAPNSAIANFVRGTVLFAKREPQAALELFDRAIALDGNLARAHAYRGLAQIALGRAEAAETHLARAMRLSPRDPMYPCWEMVVGIADLYLGRLDQAIAHLQHSTTLNRNCGWAQVALAVAIALRGNDEELLAQAREEASRLAPNFTIARYRSEVLSRHPVYLAQRERFITGLRRIGISEQ